MIDLDVKRGAMHMKYLVYKIIAITILTSFLSGCVGFGTETQGPQFENVKFESEVMELVEAEITEEEDSRKTLTAVQIDFRMRNPTENDIDDLHIVIDLCDSDDTVIDSHDFYYNSPFRAEYTENLPVTIRFDRYNLEQYDYIRITTADYTIVE